MRPRAVALLGAAVLALGACSSSSAGSAHHSAASTVESTVAPPPATTASPPASSPVPSAPAPAAAASSSSHPAAKAPTTPPETASPSVVERSTCTQVSVRVIPGGAISGREFAALQFTNSGPGRCVLVGYPTVTLLRSGKPIAKPSEPAGYTTSRRALSPGATAESKLFDYTQNCQAPLSDGVRIVVPGSSITYHRPQFVMRGCILRVDALGAPE